MVPTLIDGDIVVPESNVINEYLDERFPDPPLKPAEPFGRAVGIAVLQQPADAGGGDRLPAELHGGDDGQAHAALLGLARQEGDVAAAAVAEGEIRPAGQVLRAEAAMQHLFDEILGRHGREGVVEGQGDDMRGAGRGEGGRLGRQQGQAEGRVVGAEMLARMRLEGEGGERQVKGNPRLAVAAAGGGPLGGCMLLLRD